MYKNSNISIEIRAILNKKDGTVLKRYPWKKANSLIKAFIQILFVQMAVLGENIIDTTNVSRYTGINNANLDSSAGANTTDRGIVIGSGTTAVAMTDYKLGTQIIANVAHALQTNTLQNPNASTWRINISRTFTNNTGSTLSIGEVGLYLRGAAYLFCGDRTLYPVDVPDGIPISFTYRITITL